MNFDNEPIKIAAPSGDFFGGHNIVDSMAVHKANSVLTGHLKNSGLHTVNIGDTFIKKHQGKTMHMRVQSSGGTRNTQWRNRTLQADRPSSLNPIVKSQSVNMNI